MKNQRDTSLRIRLAGMAILGLSIALAAAAYVNGRNSKLIAMDAVPDTVAVHDMAISRSVGSVKVPASAQTNQPGEMAYVYIGPESPGDHRYDYHWQVLREALEKTKQKYGPYRMRAADYMVEERQAFELQNQGGKLTVLIRGDTLDYEKAFEAVWIPVDKGLLGYRILLIRREDQPHFTHDTTLDDLKKYSVGQGNGWKDGAIFQANGIKVVVGGDYASLFPMLANQRFDFFSRGVEEIQDEYSQRKTKLPNLAIEQNLMLYYPMARYFWFAKSDEGRRLAQRVREGMTMMVEDGTLDKMFKDAHEKMFDELHLATRKLIVLKNPLAATKVPLGDKRLWYSPLKEKESSPETNSLSSAVP